MADTTKRAFDSTTTSPLVCIQYVCLCVGGHQFFLLKCTLSHVCTNYVSVGSWGNEVYKCKCVNIHVCQFRFYSHGSKAQKRTKRGSNQPGFLTLFEQEICFAACSPIGCFRMHTMQILGLHVLRSDITVKPSHMTSHTHYPPYKALAEIIYFAQCSMTQQGLISHDLTRPLSTLRSPAAVQQQSKGLYLHDTSCPHDLTHPLSTLQICTPVQVSWGIQSCWNLALSALTFTCGPFSIILLAPLPPTPHLLICGLGVASYPAWVRGQLGAMDQLHTILSVCVCVLYFVCKHASKVTLSITLSISIPTCRCCIICYREGWRATWTQWRGVLIV